MEDTQHKKNNIHRRNIQVGVLHSRNSIPLQIHFDGSYIVWPAKPSKNIPHESLIMARVSIGSECNSIGGWKYPSSSVRMIMPDPAPISATMELRCCSSKDPTHHPSLLSCRHTRPSSENTQLFLIINTASAELPLESLVTNSPSAPFLLFACSVLVFTRSLYQ